MPRKNYNHATVVVDLLKGMQLSLPWEFTPLSQLSHSDVLRHMSISSAFLSFGHPEGFGLPVAEALASGCFVIGYTGLAGREFLELEHCSSVFTAVEFGDLASFVQSFLDFDKYFSSNISSVLGTLASSSAAYETNILSLIWFRLFHIFLRNCLLVSASTIVFKFVIAPCFANNPFSVVSLTALNWLYCH